MGDIKRMITRLGEFFKGDKKVKLIVAAGVIGIALLFASEFWPAKEKKAEQAAVPADSAQYVERLEQKLSELITTIDGVGRVKVLVTLESGVEYVYASEEKKSTDTEEVFASTGDTQTSKLKDDTENKYILVEGTGGKKEALLKTQLEPKVQGVVIVCDGAQSTVVEERIVGAVTTALGISSNRVCVAKMGQ